jgi:hypothetical protein
MFEMIAMSFGITLALSAFTRVHPAAYGCLLPILAAILMIITVSFWPNGSSTQAVGIPFAFIYAALGSIPGAFAGAGLRHLFAGRES